MVILSGCFSNFHVMPLPSFKFHCFERISHHHFVNSHLLCNQNLAFGSVVPNNFFFWRQKFKFQFSSQAISYLTFFLAFDTVGSPIFKKSFSPSVPYISLLDASFVAFFINASNVIWLSFLLLITTTFHSWVILIQWFLNPYY